MNAKQKQTINTINRAYQKLHVLNNIKWTAYRDELFSMNLKDEKRHRDSFGQGRIFETPRADCARLFVVRHIAESLIAPNLYSVADMLHIRESAIKAQALVNNYYKEIEKAWQDEDIKALANLDYIQLIDFEEYERQERIKAEYQTKSEVEA